MKKFGILNGPNLDRLGKREAEIYGEKTLTDLEHFIQKEAEHLKVEIECFQSNHEGFLIDKINDWTDGSIDGVIINPAAYSHSSFALNDAISGSKLPFIEVHLSNIYARENFRQTSLTAPACIGLISGLGFEGYSAALSALVKL